MPPDASGLGVGRGSHLHRAFMFCRGIDGFLCCGTDLFALFCFCPMYLVLRVELGPSLTSIDAPQSVRWVSLRSCSQRPIDADSPVCIHLVIAPLVAISTSAVA